MSRRNIPQLSFSQQVKQWIQTAGLNKKQALRLWFENPIFSEVRGRTPFPNILPPLFLSGLWFLAGVASWILGWRGLSALITASSIGVELLTVAMIAPLCAHWTHVQLNNNLFNARKITSLSSQDGAWGITLANLWRLRWLILAALALIPALVMSLLHWDMVNFAAWQESAKALGGASPIVQQGWLLPDGSIPLLRLVLRSLSGGCLVMVLIPLLAEVGVGAALAFNDAILGALAGLLASSIIAAAVGLAWEGISRTPVFTGGLEAIRFLLMILLCALCITGASLMNRLNALLLRNFRWATTV